MAEVKRGTGPDALPQGAAKQLNDNAAPAAKGPGIEPSPSDIPVQYGSPMPVKENDLSATPKNQLLTMPADPNFKPPPSYRGMGKVPRNLLRLLPVLGVAAKDPSAPAALRAYYEAMVERLYAETDE